MRENTMPETAMVFALAIVSIFVVHQSIQRQNSTLKLRDAVAVNRSDRQSRQYLNDQLKDDEQGSVSYYVLENPVTLKLSKSSVTKTNGTIGQVRPATELNSQLLQHLPLTGPEKILVTSSAVPSTAVDKQTTQSQE